MAPPLTTSLAGFGGLGLSWVFVTNFILPPELEAPLDVQIPEENLGVNDFSTIESLGVTGSSTIEVAEANDNSLLGAKVAMVGMGSLVELLCCIFCIRRFRQKQHKQNKLQNHDVKANSNTCDGEPDKQRSTNPRSAQGTVDQNGLRQVTGDRYALIKRGGNWAEVFLCVPLPDQSSNEYWLCSTTDAKGDSVIWAAVKLVAGQFYLLNEKGANRSYDGVDEKYVYGIDEQCVGDVEKRMDEAESVARKLSNIPEKLFAVAGDKEEEIPDIVRELWSDCFAIIKRGDSAWDEVLLCEPVMGSDWRHWLCITTDSKGTKCIWAVVELSDDSLFHILGNDADTRDKECQLAGIGVDNVNWIYDDLKHCIWGLVKDQRKRMMSHTARPIWWLQKMGYDRWNVTTCSALEEGTLDAFSSMTGECWRILLRVLFGIVFICTIAVPRYVLGEAKAAEALEEMYNEIREELPWWAKLAWRLIRTVLGL